jgi:hypothetical protein
VRKAKADKKWLEVYALQCERCAVCYHPKYGKGKRLELHHIVGRRGKDPHHHRNLIMVCSECHYAYHSGGERSLSLGHILQAKLEEDGEVDIPFLAKLMGRVGLREDPMPLPDWVAEERARAHRSPLTSRKESP